LDWTDINPHRLTSKLLLLQLRSHETKHVLSTPQKTGTGGIVSMCLSLVKALEGLLLTAIAVSCMRLKKATIGEAHIRPYGVWQGQLEMLVMFYEGDNEDGGKKKKHD